MNSRPPWVRVSTKLLTVLMFGGAACGEVRNEGGSSQSEVPDAPIAVEASPAVTVGGRSASREQSLHQVVTPFLLPDGTIAVPLAGAGEIRLFAPDGTYRNTLGRQGQGPGEFQYLMAAWPRGDTIEALDLGLRRITRFLPSGAVETIELRADIRDLSLRPGLLGSGWFIGGVVSGRAGRRDAIQIHAVDRGGDELGKLSDLDGFERVSTPDGGSIVAPLVQRGLAAGAGDRLFIVNGHTGFYQVYDSTRSRLSSGVWFSDRQYDPRQAIQHVLDSVAARAGPEHAEYARRRWGAAPVPEAVAKVAAIIGDSLGFAWVLPYDPVKHSIALSGRATGGSWRIVTPAGDMLHDVKIPNDLEPTYIGGNAVVGIARDSLGVESVRVHWLQRR